MINWRIFNKFVLDVYQMLMLHSKLIQKIIIIFFKLTAIVGTKNIAITSMYLYNCNFFHYNLST